VIVTSTAETLVAAEAAEVFAAIVDLIRGLWAVPDDDFVETEWGARLVHGVRLDGEVACWLTWQLTPVGPASTQVRVRHDELSASTVPPPALDELLAQLRATLPAHR